jgi:outer membrane immunogenic protein
MRRLACVVVAAVLSTATTAVQAADLRPVGKAPPAAPPAAYNWTGLYVGAHGGWAWADKDWTDPVAGIGAVSFTADGFIGGGQAGFNWQAGPWVLGAEVDATWSHLRKGIIAVLIGRSERRGTTVEGFGTAAARVGYAFDRWLVYGKGGAAWADDLHRTIDETVAPPAVLAIAEDTRWGYIVGAGVECGFAAGWSAKAEFNYMDFGTERTVFTSLPGSGLPPTFPLDIQQSISVVKFGVNYRFAPTLLAR